MGKIRTPKPKYFDGGVVEFFVEKNIIFYKTWIWTKDASKQFTFEQGKFDQDITSVDDIVDRALQSFSTVSKK